MFSVCSSVCGKEESRTGERSPHSPDLNILEPLDLLVFFQPKSSRVGAVLATVGGDPLSGQGNGARESGHASEQRLIPESLTAGSLGKKTHWLQA